MVNSIHNNELCFPPEIWSHIFSYLDPISLNNVSLVCKYWKRITESGLWKKNYYRDWDLRDHKIIKNKSWKILYHKNFYLREKLRNSQYEFLSYKKNYSRLFIQDMRFKEDQILLASYAQIESFNLDYENYIGTTKTGCAFVDFHNNTLLAIERWGFRAFVYRLNSKNKWKQIETIYPPNSFYFSSVDNIGFITDNIIIGQVVNCIGFSNENVLFSRSKNEFQLETKICLYNLNHGTYPIILKDSERVYTKNDDKSDIGLFNHLEKFGLRFLKWNSHLITAAEQKGVVLIWDTDTKVLLYRFDLENDINGTFLTENYLFVSTNSSIWVWDILNKENILNINSFDNFSTDTCWNDPLIRIVNRGNKIKINSVKKDRIKSYEINANSFENIEKFTYGDGILFFSYYRDLKVYVWDIESERLLYVLDELERNIDCRIGHGLGGLQYKDGLLVAISYIEGVVGVWDFENNHINPKYRKKNKISFRRICGVIKKLKPI